MILDNEKMLLEIEKVLEDELNCVANSMTRELIQDLTLAMDNSDAVRTATRVKARSSRLRLVTRENEIA